MLMLFVKLCLSWHLFHDLHSSYIVAAAIGASASGCTLGAATYNPHSKNIDWVLYNNPPSKGGRVAAHPTLIA